jgi:hypothetical protein
MYLDELPTLLMDAPSAIRCSLTPTPLSPSSKSHSDVSESDNLDVVLGGDK